MRYILISLLSIFIFTGCVTKTVYVTKKEYVKYDLPTKFITDDIVLQQPPEREVYIKSTPLEKELLMRDFVIGLYGNIASYKLKLKGIRKFDDNVSKIIKEKNKDGDI